VDLKLFKLAVSPSLWQRQELLSVWLCHCLPIWDQFTVSSCSHH